MHQSLTRQHAQANSFTPDPKNGIRSRSHHRPSIIQLRNAVDAPRMSPPQNGPASGRTEKTPTLVVVVVFGRGGGRGGRCRSGGVVVLVTLLLLTLLQLERATGVSGEVTGLMREKEHPQRQKDRKHTITTNHHHYT